MTSQSLTKKNFLEQISSLLLYQSVFDNTVGQAFLQLLSTLKNTDINNHYSKNSLLALSAYSNWFKSLATIKQGWPDYLITQILLDDNPFSQQVQQSDEKDLPPSLVAAAKHDLQVLQSIYNCSCQQISHWVQIASGSSISPVVWECKTTSTNFLHESRDWQASLTDLVNYYRQHGTGIFGQYSAFSWQGKLVGISYPDSIQLQEIVGYEWQKSALMKNTEFLLAGYRALHVLLYGSRGSGKSSLVKGLLHKYSNRSLKLIEVSKSHLHDLPLIIDQLRHLAQKFIIFVDDLSFEEDDEAFKSLKVVLEGSLTARTQNVVVYATSNRRHLIREFFGDRPRPSDAEEVHSWDTVQEKLSFSDRFGLTLTFEPANQDTYLEIVQHLATMAGISLAPKDLEFRSLQWAARHNGRSGRTARQFIDFLSGELAITDRI